MEVSVVIPVYNAEKYLSFAIDSALALVEVKEVILVEDGSPDNALEICKAYVAREQRVKLVRHPNGENRGAGASFNLGIRHASKDYVAFLGADDQFLPDRFKPANDLLRKHPDAHGVYGHIGAIYYDPVYKELHLQRVPREVSGLHNPVKPEDLLSSLLQGKNGHISLDSLVVKREILTEEYMLDESLRLAQDTDLMYRLASKYRLYAPHETILVALRGVHGANRVFQFDEAAKYRRQMSAKCIRNRYYGCKDQKAIKGVIHRYQKNSVIHNVPLLSPGLKTTLAYFSFLLRHPAIALRFVKQRIMK